EFEPLGNLVDGDVSRIRGEIRRKLGHAGVDLLRYAGNASIAPNPELSAEIRIDLLKNGHRHTQKEVKEELLLAIERAGPGLLESDNGTMQQPDRPVFQREINSKRLAVIADEDSSSGSEIITLGRDHVFFGVDAVFGHVDGIAPVVPGESGCHKLVTVTWILNMHCEV